MNSNRPIGILILAGLQLFYSGLGIVSSLGVLLIKPFRDGLIKSSMQVLKSNPDLARSGVDISADMFEGLLKVGATAGLVFGLIGIVLGIGLLKMKRWAWICTLILQALLILSGLQSLVSAFSMKVPGLSLGQQIFQLLLSIAIVVYLLMSNVRQAFTRPAS